MKLTAYHQNFMVALRQEMGWPAFKPANDAIGWTSGQPMDFETGMELGRIAQMVGKDLIYSGWKSLTSKQTTGISVAFRELLTIDIVDRLVPFAANDDAPVVLVNMRGDEIFGIDGRGTLARLHGKPKDFAAGRRLAMRRIKARAATMGDEMLVNNRHVTRGADSVEPEAPTDIIVRFG